MISGFLFGLGFVGAVMLVSIALRHIEVTLGILATLAFAIVLGGLYFIQTPASYQAAPASAPVAHAYRGDCYKPGRWAPSECD